MVASASETVAASPAGPERQPLPPPAVGTRLAVAAFTGLALVLAFRHLDHRSFAHEEAFTWAVIDQSFPALVSALVRHEGYQMLHALLEWPVNRLSSTTASLRAISALSFGAAVPAIWLAGRRLFDERAALLAALLFSLNGFALQYAQEARGYMLATALCAWAGAFLAAYVFSPGRWTRVGWIACSALAIYAHGFAVFGIASQIVALWFLPAERRRALHWIRNGEIIALWAAPAILAPVLQVSSNSLGTNSHPGLNELRGLVWSMAGRTSSAIPSIGLGIGITTFVAWQIVRRGAHSEDAFRFALPILWALLPSVVLMTASFVYPVWLERYVLWSIGGVMLLAGYGLTRLTRAGTATAAIVIVIAVALSFRGVVKWYQQPADQDYRSAMLELEARARPGDQFVFSPDEVRLTTDFFLRKSPILDSLTPVFPSQPWGHFHTGDEKILPVSQAVVDRLNAHPDHRVWIVTYTMPTVNTARINELLSSYRLVSHREYVGVVEVRLLEPR